MFCSHLGCRVVMNDAERTLGGDANDCQSLICEGIG